MTNPEIEIVPTVMPDSEDDFREKIGRVYRMVPTIQIDVMDGYFVSSKSWPYNDLGNTYWETLKKQDEGLPHWKDVNFEVDLMVRDQIGEAKNWTSAGVSRIIGHIEAFVIESNDFEIKVRDFIQVGRDSLAEVYLALSPDTANSVIDPFLDDIDGVQFMGIRNVGFQGQPFAENVLDKIKELRTKKPEIQISVDGGVNLDTAPSLIDAGATRLASGSFIFEAAEPRKAIESLKQSSR